MGFKKTISARDEQFIIDNPKLKSNVIQQFINVSTSQINRIKKEVYGSAKWLHDGNKYPYLNKLNGYYIIKHAGKFIARTRSTSKAINIIDNMISAIENNYFKRVEYDSGGFKPVKFKHIPSYQISRKQDYDKNYRGRNK